MEYNLRDVALSFIVGTTIFNRRRYVYLKEIKEYADLLTNIKNIRIQESDFSSLEEFINIKDNIFFLKPWVENDYLFKQDTEYFLLDTSLMLGVHELSDDDKDKAKKIQKQYDIEYIKTLKDEINNYRQKIFETSGIIEEKNRLLRKVKERIS